MDTTLPLPVVTFRLDQQRFLDLVTVEELIGAQQRDFPLLVALLENFVWDGTKFMSPEEGHKIVVKLTLGQLISTADKLVGGVESNLVTPLK